MEWSVAATNVAEYCSFADKALGYENSTIDACQQVGASKWVLLVHGDQCVPPTFRAEGNDVSDIAFGTLHTAKDQKWCVG